jgi:hypothetical protein
MGKRTTAAAVHPEMDERSAVVSTDGQVAANSTVLDADMLYLATNGTSNGAVGRLLTSI